MIGYERYVGNEGYEYWVYSVGGGNKIYIYVLIIFEDLDKRK